MSKHSIAWMPGDGIGNEVMDAARLVLDAMRFDAEYVPAEIGWECWRRDGDALPARTLGLLREVDAALFGAITSKPKEEAEAELAPEHRGKGLVYASPIVRLRQEFDLRVNLRPCKAYPGNPLNAREGIDLVVFRENTEDLYAGVEFHPLPEDLAAVLARHPRWARFADTPREDVAVSLRVNTRRGCEHIVRAAFEYARRHRYPHVTVVEKPNVLRETSGLMVRTARAVARDFPGVELREANVDAMAMWLVRDPGAFGVLVTTNLFGDILSDLCAQLVGGLGFAASANIGERLAVFEPTHGSAPRHHGRNRCNPMAMLLTTRLMLDWLGEGEQAARLEAAIATTVAEGRARTYDMGGDSSTTEVAEEVARNLP
jgi:3-isopropylmalate dehydrogenase